MAKNGVTYRTKKGRKEKDDDNENETENVTQIKRKCAKEGKICEAQRKNAIIKDY